ncbi:anti-sigma F factor [Clostridium sp. MSJ-8]|jgi:stage II sporulation protein AB (anti-sigma F factor)|uniref:anti-sigma F factor n=1 Tax=Clostridium sp. MSJ-8 TaxID=2841510 RepID=UPI001C0EC611|nr:anti-sigma F factor [Clostridium sp. MSJ-8]MBU5486585.1 anti-sigma F factor [Clostridium sp. MSJ-8]
MHDNKIVLEIESRSQNESYARVAVAAFVAQLDPTVEELSDIKTAVSEAVTNSIIHGYDGKEDCIIRIEVCLYGNEAKIVIIDYGKGIKDIQQAMEPLYTSRPDLERSGMGFTVMESFMDNIEVDSTEGKGTKIVLYKKFNSVN